MSEYRLQGFDHEIKFWETWLENKGHPWEDDYTFRLNPKSEFSYKDRLINNRAKGQTKFRVLDVGAGPLTRCGYVLPTPYVMELIPIDPLAKLFDVALKKNKIEPIVRTRQLKGEEIRNAFVPGFFDFAFSINALDHSQDPLDVMRQMVEVVKPGCEIVISGNTNEAINENYTGLHQFNFANVEGMFVIHSKNLPKQIDVLTELRKHHNVTLVCNESSRAFGRTKTGWIQCTITRDKND
jgi:SAM-dependent methyltransferase